MPIGVSFLPTADAAAQGPQQAGLEGDLGQAFKILALRLPQVVGPRSISPQVTGAGSAGLPSGTDPLAAALQALLHAMSAGTTPPMGGAPPSGTAPSAPWTPSGGPPTSPTGQPLAGGIPPPRIIPGNTGPGAPSPIVTPGPGGGWRGRSY